MFFDNNPKVKLYDGAIEIDRTLFLRQVSNGQRQLAHMLGESNIKERSIDNFKNNIIEGISYCNNNNVKYLHTVFPAKPVVFKSKFKSAGLNINSLFHEFYNDESVLYPLSIMDESHFCSDDTHNTHASFESISRLIIHKLGLELPELSPFYSEVKGRGDLGIMTRKKPIDKNYFLGFKKHVSQISKFTNMKSTSNSGFIDYTVNHNPIFDKRLLIFGDSFFRYSLNIYANYFKEVVYMRSPFILKDIADNLRPDIILTGNAERYLVDVPNNKQSKPYFLNYFNNNFKPELISDSSKTAFFNLFKGRDNKAFLSWFEGNSIKFKEGIYDKPLDEIKYEDLKAGEHVNYVRDQAIRLELNNIGLSKYLMGLANKKRPSGRFIMKKLNEYGKNYL